MRAPQKHVSASHAGSFTYCRIGICHCNSVLVMDPSCMRCQSDARKFGDASCTSIGILFNAAIMPLWSLKDSQSTRCTSSLSQRTRVIRNIAVASRLATEESLCVATHSLVTHKLTITTRSRTKSMTRTLQRWVGPARRFPHPESRTSCAIAPRSTRRRVQIHCEPS